MGLSHLKVDRVKTLVDGAAAGDITVTGITTNDRLASVIYIAATLANSEDLTSEFSITAANTINNTGGTATIGGGVDCRVRQRRSSWWRLE
jgi:hypothetical protein